MSSTMEPSHVLVAMGLIREEADESIHVSLGRPRGIVIAAILRELLKDDEDDA